MLFDLLNPLQHDPGSDDSGVHIACPHRGEVPLILPRLEDSKRYHTDILGHPFARSGQFIHHAARHRVVGGKNGGYFRHLGEQFPRRLHASRLLQIPGKDILFIGGQPTPVHCIQIAHPLLIGA